MARDIARILARLIGAARDDILDRLRRGRIFRDQSSDHAAEQIVRAHRREASRVPAERGSQAVKNKGVAHGVGLARVI